MNNPNSDNTNIINFPTPENAESGFDEETTDTGEENKAIRFVKSPDELTIEEKNRIFFLTAEERIKLEVKALKKTAKARGMGTTFIEDDLEDLCMNLLSLSWNRNEKGYNSKGDIKAIIAHLLQGMSALFSGQILAPIYGTDEEWENIKNSSMIGQTLVIPFRGKQVEINVESVQINKRLTSIFRFNNDNRYAHRRDFFRFVDDVNHSHIITTDDSVRYIQFPYEGQIAACRVEVNDDTKSITEYFDIPLEAVQNEVIFPDIMADTQTNPYAYVFAPPIPFFMLEEFGINLDDEVAQFESVVQKALNKLHDDDEVDSDPDSEGQVDEDAVE